MTGQILKKEDPANLKKYKGMRLLSVLGKTMMKVIFNRIRPVLEEVAGKKQCAFRPG